MRRRLLLAVEDDGSTQTYVIQRFEYIGDVEIGPMEVAKFQCLSFPTYSVEDWQREMVEHMREHL